MVRGWRHLQGYTGVILGYGIIECRYVLTMSLLFFVAYGGMFPRRSGMVLQQFGVSVVREYVL